MTTGRPTFSGLNDQEGRNPEPPNTVQMVWNALREQQRRQDQMMKLQTEMQAQQTQMMNNLVHLLEKETTSTTAALATTTATGSSPATGNSPFRQVMCNSLPGDMSEIPNLSATPNREISESSSDIHAGQSLPVQNSIIAQGPGDSDSWRQVATLLARSTSLIEKPLFRGRDEDNAIVFLSKFESYTKHVHCADKDKLSVVGECLKGSARQWYLLRKNNWSDFAAFKGDFTQTYWSDARQRRLRGKLLNLTYRSDQGSMTEHFISCMNQARYLQFQIPEAVVVSDVMEHFPDNIRTAWLLNERKTLQDALRILSAGDNLSKTGRSSRETKDTPTSSKRPYWNARAVPNRVYDNVPPPKQLKFARAHSDQVNTIATNRPTTARAVIPKPAAGEKNGNVSENA